MSAEMTPKQKTLVKARKAGRVAFALILMGGAILVLYGIYTQYFPTILNGLVMLLASVLPLVLSAIAEKRLSKTLS